MLFRSNLYARRAAREGYAFKLEPRDYTKFAESFGFEETPDQAAAISAVIADMSLLFQTSRAAWLWLVGGNLVCYGILWAVRLLHAMPPASTLSALSAH